MINIRLLVPKLSKLSAKSFFPLVQFARLDQANFYSSNTKSSCDPEKLINSKNKTKAKSVNSLKNEKPNIDKSLTSKTDQSRTIETNQSDLTEINEARIAEIMEYYSQYEKELSEGGYKDPEVEDGWLQGSQGHNMEKYPIHLERGKEGVFDVEEMVEVLKHQKVLDLCCLKLPADLQYCDYLIVGTSHSIRHLRGVIQYLLTLYKKKRGPNDPEGLRHPEKQTRMSKNKLFDHDWMTLDIGNLILHLMMPETRLQYDIEQLWGVGPEFDQKTLEKTQMDELEEEFEKFRRQIEESQKQSC